MKSPNVAEVNGAGDAALRYRTPYFLHDLKSPLRYF
jgi:hypothetical protein